MSDVSAGHAGRDRAARRSARRRPARRSCIFMRAIRRPAQPTPDPDVFMQFLPRIKQSTDAVVNITTGGGLTMTVDDRLAAPLRLKPEMCSLNMGSMNFAHLPASPTASRPGSTTGRKAISATPTTTFSATRFATSQRSSETTRRGAWHALRARVLRRRPPLQSRPFRRPRHGQAAVLRAADLRHPGRHRRRAATT